MANHGGVDWDTCTKDDCIGVRVFTGERCWAHATEHDLDAALKQLAEDGKLDARGVTFTTGLLRRILDAARKYGRGKVVLATAECCDATFKCDAWFLEVHFKGYVDFDGASFGGRVGFVGASFNGITLFRRTNFGSATWFNGATFSRESWFSNASFGGPVWFNDANFQGATSFECVKFCGEVWFGDFGSGYGFGGVNFGGAVRFREATFRHDVGFEKATFDGDASFVGASFGGRAAFGGANFGCGAGFEAAWFDGDTEFIGASFGDYTDFEAAKFEGAAGFMGAYFDDKVSFIGAKFSNFTDFGGATFRRYAGFIRASFGYNVSFSRASFGGLAGFGASSFGGDVQYVGASFGGGGWFEAASFGGVANFSLAVFRGNADFTGAALLRARELGPMLVRRSLRLDGATFHERTVVEVSAAAVCCRRARFLAGVQMRVRHAQVAMDDADLATPSILANARPFENLEEGRWAQLLQGLRRGDSSDSRPRLVSLRRADVAGLTLAGVDLRACRFAGALHLDRLQIHEAEFARASTNGRWTIRRAIGEEHHWRATGQLGGHRSVATTATPSGGASGWYGREEQPPDWLDVEAVPPAQIGAVYRSLRKGREDSKDAPGAADFYYGEMEMRRHDVTAPRGEQIVVFLYWLFSGYGLRASRALAWLLGILVAATVLLAIFGLDQAGDWSFPARLGTAAVVAVEGAVFRTAEQDLTYEGRWIHLLPRVAGPVLLALAALSIRGRVKR